MPKLSKRMAELSAQVDKTKTYSLPEAVELVLKTAKAKFTPSVELHARLGINIKKTDQQVRSTVDLPHGSGKTQRVAVVTSLADKAQEAKDAGADLIGETDLINEIKGGKINFDVLVATPEIMKSLSAAAKTLGPRGLMPNPKSDTVSNDIAGTVRALKKGKIAFKNDDTGNIHMLVGKANMTSAQLIENITAAVDALKAAKPSSAKGTFLQNVVITSTMGPSIRVAAETL